MVEYTPGYLADHWCQKGHVLLVLEGELHTELADGRTVVLKQGQSYQVADGDARPSFAHRQAAPNSSSWTDMTDMIGFIGVGTMGEPMCRNLARKSGLTVLAADRDEAPLQAAGRRRREEPPRSTRSPPSCRTIFLSLPGGKEVEQVCLGEGGLVSKAKLGWTVIDLSTAPVNLARRLYAEFEGKASAFADAPVARTRQAAIDGTLSIMVGGTSRLLRPHRAAAAPHGERGHLLRRGGQRPGGQDPEQHDPVPDRRGAGRGAVASRAPTASTARCCSRP